MKKKRIAIFGVKYFPSRGGTSRVVEQLVAALKDRYEFTIYCYRNETASKYMEGVSVVEFPEIKIKGIGVFLYYLRCCWHLVRKGNYDLVHIHKTDATFFLPWITRKYTTIATSHALPYMNEKWSKVGKAYFRKVERMFMQSEAYQTSISRPQADYYEEKYGKKVHFIPNGVEPIEEPPRAELAENILAQHQVQGDYLLFAARRIVPLKGLHTLVEALQRMNYTGTLVVAGDSEQMPAYSKQVKEAAKGLNVKFIGYISDKETLYSLVQQAQFFIFPSELEGMSVMLLEVGSLGTPMVCSDIPQNTAVFGDEEVLFFRSKDAGDLTDKLEQAHQDPQFMKELATKAVAKIVQHYSVSASSAQYAALYDQLLDEKPRL